MLKVYFFLTGRPISVDWAIAKNEYMQYHINKELEMQEDIKKEDSDSDDDGPPMNISNNELKNEIKSKFVILVIVPQF